MPKPGLAVAEAPTRPLERAQGGREPHFELVPVCIGDERLACRSARRDPEHVPLPVLVREEVEVELPANPILLEERHPAEVLEASYLLRVDAGLVERVAVVGDVAVGVLDESLQLRQLKLVQLLAREAFGLAQVQVQLPCAA